MSSQSSGTSKQIDLLFWLVAGCVLAPVLAFIYQQYAPNLDYDFWLHAASVEAFRRSPANPDFTVFLDFDRRNLSPYHLALGTAARIFSISSQRALIFCGALNVLLLVFAMGRLASLLPGVGRYNAGLLLLCAVSLWGLPGWYSGEYHLITLPWIASYPSILCFALSLYGLFYCAEFARRPHWQPFAVVLLISFIVSAIHQLTWLYFFVPASAVFLWYFGLSLGRIVLCLAALTLAALTFFTLWPYMPLPEVLKIFQTFFASKLYSLGSGGFTRSSSMEVRFFDWKVLDFTAPAFLGVLGWFFAATKRERWFLRILCLLPISLWLSSGFFDWPPLGWRLTIYIVWWLQFSAAWFLCGSLGNRRAKLFAIPLLPLCALLLALHLRGGILFAESGRTLNFSQIESEVRAAQAEIGSAPLLSADHELLRVFRSFGRPIAMSECFNQQFMEKRHLLPSTEPALSATCHTEFAGEGRFVVTARPKSELLGQGNLEPPLDLLLVKHGTLFNIYTIKSR